MISSAQPWQPLSRNDRHVRRASLRLPSGVSEHRATFLVEEALRLMALPGEDQGRAYYFRRVALRDLAATAPPSDWIDRAQSTMRVLASRALHGTDTRAAGSDAVFFNSQEEALKWLLRRFFRAPPNEATDVWFARMISPMASGINQTMQVVAVIERLRSLSSGWFAAATVLLDAVEDDFAAISVFEAIPERVLRVWSSELGGLAGRGSYAPRISANRRLLLRRRLARYDHATLLYWASRDAGGGANSTALRSVRREMPMHLVWLAALVVAAEHPGELARGSALAGGRAILEELAEATDRASVRDDRDLAAPSPLHGAVLSPDVPDYEQTAPLTERNTRDSLEDRDRLKPHADTITDYSVYTEAGGLYFLLNVLRQLGIEQAFEALPMALGSVFTAKLIESLARAALIVQADPALLRMAVAPGFVSLDEGFNCAVPAVCWPGTLLAPPEKALTLDRLIRAWTVAVRRWCWLNARLTLHEIVSRPGRISLTRTELDVTLSMGSVDLRLRRIGLDLDPGWLPWFGRVVRFHYIDEPLRGGVDGGESL